MDVKRKTSEILLRKLAFSCSEARKQALLEIRLLSKWDVDNRICLAEAGAIPLLVDLLPARERRIQENAVTALLNMSIHPGNKEAIIKAPGAINSIVRVIEHGSSSEARSNAAALLFSLLVDEKNRSSLGSSPGLIEALLGLLQDWNARCKTDSLNAVFHLALCPANRSRLVAAGAIPNLLSLLIHGNAKTTEGALAVLAQIAGCHEGSTALMNASALPVIMNLLDKGTPRTQENAAAVLVNLCQYGDNAANILDRERLIPALRRLYDCGSQRGKSKADSLMKILNLDIFQGIQDDKRKHESIGPQVSEQPAALCLDFCLASLEKDATRTKSCSESIVGDPIMEPVLGFKTFEHHDQQMCVRPRPVICQTDQRKGGLVDV